MVQKECTQCKITKPLDKFGIRNRAKNIRHEWCRVCLNEYAKKYREKNKTVVIQRQKQWYENSGKEWKKIYDKKNLERSRIRDRNRYYSDTVFRTKKY